MFDNIVWLPSQKFHFEEAELGVNAVQFIDNGLDARIFLCECSVLYQLQTRDHMTHIQYHLANYMLVRKVFLVEVEVGWMAMNGVVGTSYSETLTDVADHRESRGCTLTQLFRKEGMQYFVCHM
jgi:hypothetical protein